MGQIKNIKLHIVTDIKVRSKSNNLVTQYFTVHFNMTNMTEKPTASQPVEENHVEKQQPSTQAEPETEAATHIETESEKNAEGLTEENTHRDKVNSNDQSDAVVTKEKEEEDVNHGKNMDADEKDESILKRKDQPLETENSPKKKKLVDEEEKEAETVTPAAAEV